ncbi:MAG: cytochrome b N-terminal domain-containing protein [Opitutaceae bacterium]|nr:cytochrome b N-terminal domain-containing protein [Opitutaceae bacterium]
MSAGSHDVPPSAGLMAEPALLGHDTSAPGAPTRLDGLFRRLDRVVAWCDGWSRRWLPEAWNPLAQSGTATNFALAVAVVSGVALLLWYSPSVQFAYSSLEAIGGRTLGGWVRAMHRYSSDLAMLLILVHAGRMLVARKFAGARWIAWVSGVGLIALVWFIGWTGYWLVWDQPAQQVAVTSMWGLDVVPIFGEPMSRLYLADRLVPSLLFFVVFFLHMLLPLAIAVGLVVHLLRLNRVRLFPARGLMAALVLALALASWLKPAPLDAPARMAEKAETFTVDAWYLTPLALALRLQGGGLWLALGGGIVLGGLIPWVLGRRPTRARRAPGASSGPVADWQTFVDESRCHACTQCVQDCPFDAVAMTTRSDGKRFETRALVDPARCVGCAVCVGSCDSEAMNLPWFDTQREEARIEREALAGGEVWVALVGGDIDGGRERFASGQWTTLLAGYSVHFVPTASWVRPKFVERLLARGVRGVVVVRDVRTESAARDGNRWIGERLAGTRKPAFRPARAGDNAAAWRVLAFDAARPAELTRAAEAFRTGRDLPMAPTPRATPAPWRLALAGVALAAGLGAAVVAPSHLRVVNPSSPAPEFVFSFKALGEMQAAGELDPEQEAKKPLHMRGRSTEKPHRAPVVVRLTIDGVSEERTFRAKGISEDGPVIAQWRVPIATGSRVVSIEMQTGAAEPQRWEGAFVATERRLCVVTYDPGEGFRLEDLCGVMPSSPGGALP